MQNVDALIILIRDRRHDEALAMLNTFPELADEGAKLAV